MFLWQVYEYNDQVINSAYVRPSLVDMFLSVANTFDNKVGDAGCLEVDVVVNIIYAGLLCPHHLPEIRDGTYIFALP